MRRHWRPGYVVNALSSGEIRMVVKPGIQNAGLLSRIVLLPLEQFTFFVDGSGSWEPAHVGQKPISTATSQRETL